MAEEEDQADEEEEDGDAEKEEGKMIHLSLEIRLKIFQTPNAMFRS